MATNSSILAWRIPRTEMPGRVQSTRSQESDTTERLNHHHQRVRCWTMGEVYSETVSQYFVPAMMWVFSQLLDMEELLN